MKKYVIGIVKLSTFCVITILLLPIYLLAKFVGGRFSLDWHFLVSSLWSRLGLLLCNIKVKISGTKEPDCNVYVCNHISWLDILALQSLLKVSFIAKSEVKSWPVFGFLARIADTVFIERRATAAKSQQIELVQALRLGRSLCLFPEGTSTDGSKILPFKSSLFEVFVLNDNEISPNVIVQPITLVYLDAKNQISTEFGWWGDMNLLGHIFDVVAHVKSGTVSVVFEKPIQAKKLGNRKTLALKAELAIKKRISSYRFKRSEK